MKMLNAMLAPLLMTIAVHSTATQTPSLKPWASASYRGLIMGKSTRADVYKVLGKPKWVGREQDTRRPMITYDVSYPVIGELDVDIDKGILISMGLRPKMQMHTKDVIRLFGHDYIVVHYSFDDCLGEGGTAPIYENPNGDFKHLEYRSLGLAAVFTYQNDEIVEEIVYTSGPFGPTHSLCADRSKKK